MRLTLARRMEERAARRRAAIADALAQQGVASAVEVEVEGDGVRASAPGLKARWWRDLTLREAGRSGR